MTKAAAKKKARRTSHKRKVQTVHITNRVSPEAHAKLDWLCERRQESQRQTIEAAILSLWQCEQGDLVEQSERVR